jgi:hypothetical protein
MKMSLQYREAADQIAVTGASMRSRDALKRILVELDAAVVAKDGISARSHLHEARRLTELGLAFNVPKP